MTQTSPDWASIRAEFPALNRWTCLNTAAYGLLPTRATKAVADYWDRCNELACADFLDWYEDATRIRAAIARLIHASPEDIAFVPNAATALAQIASGLGLKSGDNIVTLDDEFPNYQYGVQSKAQPWEKFYDAIDRHTRLIALSEVNYATGFRAPLAEIYRVAQDRRVPLFVDGSESVGALQFDVTKTPVDVLAVHADKWMVVPTGVGFMYVSPALRERAAPSTGVGWLLNKDRRNSDAANSGKSGIKSASQKYEAGGLPFGLLYALEATVNWMLEIGPEAIEKRVLHLASGVQTILKDLGAATDDVPLAGSNRLTGGANSQIITGYWPYRDASELAKQLRAHSVLVAAREGKLRISPHFYNNEADLARLRDVLAANLK